MKKIYSFLLLTVLLLISGNAWADNVAKIGTTEYATLKLALNAVQNGETIVLLENTSLGDATTFTDKNVTIDLNSKTLTTTKDDAIVVLGTTRLVLKNGTVNHNTSWEPIWMKTNSDSKRSYVRYENITMTSQMYCLYCSEKSGTVEVVNSSLKSTGDGVINWAISEKGETAPTLTIDNSTIICRNEGNSTTAAIQMAGKASFNNVKIDADFCGIAFFEQSSLLIEGEETEIKGSTCISTNGAKLGCTEINIIDGVFNACYENEEEPGCAFYHANPCTLNIQGGTFKGKSALIIKGGDVNIYGGTFIANGPAKDPDKAGFSGAEVTGDAIYIEDNYGKADNVLTHNITLNIYGGSFYSANANAIAGRYNNTDVNKVPAKIAISGGEFTTGSESGYAFFTNHAFNGTFNVTNGLFLGGIKTEYRCTWLRGGKYSHNPSAFVAPGYYSHDITEDPYIYEVGPRNDFEDKATSGALAGGEWKADGTWGAETETPTAATAVTVAEDNEVWIANGTVAEAYGVTIEDNTKLTVENGGVLIVGAGGVNGATENNFIVEDGGTLVIAPAQTIARPRGTVKYIAKYAGLKSGATSPYSSDDLYWEQFAIPTVGKPESFTSEPSYFNTWDITDAWVATNRDGVDTPFKGYFFSNQTAYSVSEKNNEYVFEGEMIGNQVNVLNFAREGFTFFGNSYTAPISIPELLNELNVDDVEATVYIYRPLEEAYYTINKATVGRGGRPKEIKSLQGFFVYAANSATVSSNYTNVVWNALLAKKTTVGAPARSSRQQFAVEATLTLTSVNGITDELVVLEQADFTAAFDQNYDARKMKNASGLNVYVSGETDLAVFATDELVGTPVTVETAADVQYTFAFSDVAGDIALYDAETGVTTTMENGASYTFVAQPNSTITERFSIVSAPRVATAMESVEAAKAGIYTVTGLYLGEATNWNNLPKGVYIVNGQKLVK